MAVTVDWSKLHPYAHTQQRSFEELCYQIAKGLYGSEGTFTSVDDSGGGDGVEFYLTLPNGDQWGWQAKYYHPNQRLSVSGRKASIIQSLAKACQEHPRLTRWLLCTPTNLTRTERNWFETALANSLPTGSQIELIHWQESDFIDWLSLPRFAGKRNYFFASFELNMDWCRNQLEKQLAGIGEKFNNTLHTEGDIDARIHQFLGDQQFAEAFSRYTQALEHDLKEHQNSIKELQETIQSNLWNASQIDFSAAASDLGQALSNALDYLHQALDLLIEQRIAAIHKLTWDEVWNQMDKAYKRYGLELSEFKRGGRQHVGKEEIQSSELDDLDRRMRKPYYLAANFMDQWRDVRSRLDSSSESSLHILGQAGVGKTHIASHICDQRISNSQPTILLRGGNFTSALPLDQQLRALLDIPPAYSWNDFLQALDAFAEAYNTRIPLIIDGLNESTSEGRFSSVWKNGLAGLSTEITNTTHRVVLVTTCRESYRSEIWHDSADNFVFAQGFDTYNIEDAVQKYFYYYNIRADLTAASLSQFQHPIYLKIFCETKNPNREFEVAIYIGEQTLFEVFDEFLNQCNKSVCDRQLLHRNVQIVKPVLHRLAGYLWEQDSRQIPLTNVVELVDGKPLDQVVPWITSRTNALESEGLLIYRDWLYDAEVMSFTYDLLGGYLIARYLLQEKASQIRDFLQDARIESKIFGDDFQLLHPLHEDIVRCLAALLPTEADEFLHNISKNKNAFSASINALFEISPSKITIECISLLTNLFGIEKNRSILLMKYESTIAHVGHPLNANYLSEQIKALSMPDRDISWSEHLRAKFEITEKIIREFENRCKSADHLSKWSEDRLHLLASHIRWMLTSTVRDIRYRASRALYWYGRRFPNHLLELCLKSLDINDPYVPERMLAAIYGVTMACHIDIQDDSFTQEILPVYGRQLFDSLFQVHASFATTHILSRDYARRTIEVALLHHPNLLKAEEHQRIRPPFQDGGIRNWGRSADKNPQEYRDGNCPFDFFDDPMGNLGEDIDKYHDDTPQYRLAKSQLWWRIYDLGYTLEQFGVVDATIGRIWAGRTSDDAQWTEHYGKKYCNIALHELAGYRDDQGRLNKARDINPTRYYYADIDPSFAQMPQKIDIFNLDLLGDRTLPLNEWIVGGEVPDVNPFLVLDNIPHIPGSWALLNGVVRQTDNETGRNSFLHINGFVVRSNQVASLVKLLRENSHKHRSLPGNPQEHYTYPGEIPWSDTYPYNEWEKIEIRLGKKIVKKKRNRVLILRNGEPISDQETINLIESFSSFFIYKKAKRGRKRIVMPEKTSEFEMAFGRKLLEQGLTCEPYESVEEEEVMQVKKFPALVPVRENRFEGEHVLNRVIGSTPARQIAEHLDLHGKPQTFDFFDCTGERASLTCSFGEDIWRNKQDAVLLRKDLLQRYLDDTNTNLIWVIWGDRGFSPHHANFRDHTNQHLPYESFQVIEVYSGNK